MGSPPRIFREVELMDIDNLFEAYIRDHNPEYLNEVVPRLVAENIRQSARLLAMNQQLGNPQNRQGDPIGPAPPLYPRFLTRHSYMNSVNEAPEIVQRHIDSISQGDRRIIEISHSPDIDDVESSDSMDSRSSSIILIPTSHSRPGRFIGSSEESSDDSGSESPGYSSPAGSPVGFPTEPPLSTSETSESSEMGSPSMSQMESPNTSQMGSSGTTPDISPMGSRETSPIRSPATSSTQSPAIYTQTATTVQTNSSKIDNPKTEDEAFSCSICLDSLTNTGLHKPACLKCGHIFGENCLHRWIKVGCNRDARRCPTCNTKACIKDIRVLYTKNLVAIDTAELTALQIKLEKENRAKNLMHIEVEKWKNKATDLDKEVKRLKTAVDEEAFDRPSTSGPTAIRQCIKKINLCKNKGCRVLAFNKANMMLVASQHSESPLFQNSHVIRKLNGAILEASKEYIFAHKKQIRDMAFHSTDQHVLASVSLDKCVNLTDLNSNTVVCSLDVGEPLWSCCWAGDNTHTLVAGGQMGSLFYMDRRFMKLYNSEQSRKLACVSLIPLPPSGTRSFVQGGFLKTRMDYLSVFEHEPGVEPSIYRETELPLRALWACSSYDSQSNLILSTAKPTGLNKSVRHIVSRIRNVNAEGPIVSPVATFYGGDKATQISRSCLVPSNGGSNADILACSFDERSSTIKVFNVNVGNNVHNFHVKDNFLDLCPLTGVIINGRRTMAGLSENSISVFSV